MLGAGTVGRAVIAGLLDHPERLLSTDGAALELGGIAVRDPDREREPGLPPELLTDAPAHLVADPAIDVVVEVMGGDEPARTLIAAALGAGKAVVTANKHVIAHHGPALEAAARRSGAALRFEAAVGGGIPVLGPLAGDLAADDITRVRGIVNGTTNHILTAMTRDHAPYAAVLADAQQRGYAETDPSGDVEGDDAVNKLVILARLAFGTWLDPATVGRRPPTTRGPGRPGITGVTADDIAGADALGMTIKLLATAVRRDDGVTAAVLPTAVPCASAFGRTDGVTNAVEIDAEPLGTVMLTGPGAGGPATSSAVLNDLAAIARGGGSTWAGLAPATDPATPATDPLDGPHRWFALAPGRPAIETEAMSIDEARAALGDDADVTLYPIDA
jgi:homoserine dehydrogenase